jgi:hypothetical protein
MMPRSRLRLVSIAFGKKASANLVLFLPDVKPPATFTASGRLMLGRADRIGRNVLGGKTLTCEPFML